MMFSSACILIWAWNAFNFILGPKLLPVFNSQRHIVVTTHYSCIALQDCFWAAHKPYAIAFEWAQQPSRRRWKMWYIYLVVVVVGSVCQKTKRSKRRRSTRDEHKMHSVLYIYIYAFQLLSVAVEMRLESKLHSGQRPR